MNLLDYMTANIALGNLEDMKGYAIVADRTEESNEDEQNIKHELKRTKLPLGDDDDEKDEEKEKEKEEEDDKEEVEKEDNDDDQ